MALLQLPASPLRFLLPEPDLLPTSTCPAQRTLPRYSPTAAERDRRHDREVRRTLPNPCGHTARPIPEAVEGSPEKPYPGPDPLKDLLFLGCQ